MYLFFFLIDVFLIFQCKFQIYRLQSVFGGHMYFFELWRFKISVGRGDSSHFPHIYNSLKTGRAGIVCSSVMVVPHMTFMHSEWVPLAGLLLKKNYFRKTGEGPSLHFRGDSSQALGWRLAFFGVTPRARRHPKKRFLARGVTPKTVRKATRMCEASPYCYNLAHIYVSWSYVWKYTNVKVTFLSIKTICRALSLLVLKILAVYWDTRY